MPVTFDIARLMPPAMRASVGRRAFGWIRLGVWCALVAGLLFLPRKGQHAQGFVEHTSIAGSEEFALGTLDGNEALDVNGRARPITGTPELLHVVDTAGADWQIALSDGQLKIAHGTQTYRIKPSEEGVIIYDATDTVVCKVKNKGDKFNIYDGNDTRILHGKQGKRSVVVRDDSDVERYRVYGASVEDAPILVLPLPIEARALYWQHRDALHYVNGGTGGAVDAVDGG